MLVGYRYFFAAFLMFILIARRNYDALLFPIFIVFCENLLEISSLLRLYPEVNFLVRAELERRVQSASFPNCRGG